MTIKNYNFTTILMGVIIALGLILFLPPTAPTVEAQGLPPISIVPASGPPGTTVTITRSDGGPLNNCLANGDPSGFTYQTITSPPPGQAIATWVVPSTASGSINFECELSVGPSVPPPPTFIGTFRVTAPPPPPPPNNPPAPPPTFPASLTPLNGPPGTIVTVSNPDPIRTLSCTVLGPDSAPLGTIDTPTAGNATYPIPTNIGDNLQLIFVCSPTPIGGETIDSQLFTFTIDNVCTPRTDWQFEYTVQADETLFEIAQSLQLDHNILCEANCDRVPVCSQIHRGNVLRVPTTPPPISTDPDNNDVPNPTVDTGVVGIAPLDLDLFDIFGACPEFIPTPENTPAHFQILGIAASTNPCDSLLTDLLGRPFYIPLSDDALRQLLNSCPQAGTLLIGFLTSLAEWDVGLAQRIDSQVTIQNVCDVANAIAQKTRLPINIARVVPNNSTAYARLQTSDAELKYIITACVQSVDSDRRDTVLNRLHNLQITADELYSDPAKCGFIKQLMTVGPFGTTVLEGQFYEVLTACNSSPNYAAKQQSHQLFGAVLVSGVDMYAMLNDPDLCNTPVNVYINNLPSIFVSSIHPDIPLQLRGCPITAHSLRSFTHANGIGISTYDLWLISTAPDPCSAGSAFVRGGFLPLRPILDPNCIIRHDAFIQATVILRDNTTLFQIADTDSWQQRTRYISRPPSRLCDPLDDLESVEDTRRDTNRATICVQAHFALQNETDTPSTARLRIVSTDSSGPTPTHYAETAIISRQFMPSVPSPDFTVTAFVNDRSNTNLQLGVMQDFGNLTDRTARVDPNAVVDIVDRRECLREFTPIPPPPPPLPQAVFSIAAPLQSAPTAPQPVEAPQVFVQQPDDNPTIMITFIGTRLNGTSEIYIGQGGSVNQFTDDGLSTKVFPAMDELGSNIAFIEIDPSSNTAQLQVQAIEGPTTATPYHFEGFEIVPAQLAWTPDSHILITLRDLETNTLGIYEIDPASASGFLQPRLKVANAASPTISRDGSVVAFERISDGVSQIWTTTLIGFGEQRISDQPTGVSCYEPDFGPQALYFLCEVDGIASLYRYDAGGSLALFQSTGDSAISYPAGAPAAGYLGYDDGVRIFLRRDSETASIEAILADDPSGNIRFSQLQWQPIFQAR